MTALGGELVTGLWAGPAPATWTTATAATPGPAEPEVQEGVDPDSVTPGVLGFAVTLAAVLACIPLFLSMTRKIRGVQHRGRLEEAAARAAAADGPADVPPAGSPRTDVPPSGSPATDVPPVDDAPGGAAGGPRP
ncbi:hypothetical protein [Actinotalea solisilvae]|uniref:hypothetical protein n=1 Tax=Actinotalea solisilvae TaxID=2072922 RepID=UPI0018F23CBF|nr:hypothetical protein [Actinotalea solisilvae]